MFRKAKVEAVKEEVSQKQSQLKRPMDKAEVMHIKDTITTTDLFPMIRRPSTYVSERKYLQELLFICGFYIEINLKKLFHDTDKNSRNCK